MSLLKRVMKEVQLTEFGKAQEVVSVQEVSPQVLGGGLEEGQVEVRMLVAPINPADINFIEGTYGVKPVLPAVPGIEGCGIVEDSRASGVNVGDTVIFLKRVGTWSQRVVCDADALYVISRDLCREQASMLKVNPMTALCLLEDYTSLQAGDWVIQNAANSGVGQCVIQIAKLLGLRTINLVRRAELVAELEPLGADIVLVEDEGGVQQLKEISQKLEVKLACNAVGGESSIRLMSALVEQGVHVTYGAMSRRPVTIPNKFLIFKRIRFEGLWVTKWLEETSQSEVHRRYAQLAQWVEEGKLTQTIAARYPLEDIKQALAHAQQDKRTGKVVLSLAE